MISLWLALTVAAAQARGVGSMPDAGARPLGLSASETTADAGPRATARPTVVSASSPNAAQRAETTTDAGPRSTGLKASSPDAGAQEPAGLRRIVWPLFDAGVENTASVLGAPAGLSCLPNWYAGTVARDADGGWGLLLDGGTFLPWEHAPLSRPPDGGEGDESEVAALSDIYRPPYVSGLIVPVETRDAGAIEDPGRARVEQLFLTTYGSTRSEVQARLSSVRFFTVRYGFHQLAAPALERVVERLRAAMKTNPKLWPFLNDIGGTFIWRRIKGSQNLSTHAFGLAIDINVERSSYWRWTFKGQPVIWKNRVPQEIVDAFEAEGFIWGGRWAHYDTMHFEFRPELLSPKCQGE